MYTSGELIGSDFLADQLGLDVDQIKRRLGDAGYEAYLIRQQLINETGNNRLAGYGGEQSMIEGLYNAAAEQKGDLGLTWGEPLTAQQVADLDQDMVWMVEKEVDGQTVLAPQVYLSESTRNAVREGAVIAADNTYLDVENVNNTGGTLDGGDNLVIKTTADITNTGGDLTGGNIYLQAGGDVVNETLAEGAGDATTYRTVLGKTANIDSEGDLLVAAGNDIDNTGADLAAEGTAILDAGNDINIDTIENKTTGTTYDDTGDSRTLETVSENNHIGSELDMDSDLAVRSGGDATIGGSDVDVDGNLISETGGSFKVESRQDSTTTHTVKKRVAPAWVAASGATRPPPPMTSRAPTRPPI